MKIYVINGYPCSGKDTFCEFVLSQTRYGEIISTVDCIKDIARAAGWDGVKNRASRQFLSNLKDLMTDWLDYPHQDVLRRIKLYKKELESYGFPKEIIDHLPIFIMCREPSEIHRFVSELGVKTIYVKRDGVEYPEGLCSTDLNVDEYDYDIEINNDGTLEDLKQKAKDFRIAEDLYDISFYLELCGIQPQH